MIPPFLLSPTGIMGTLIVVLSASNLLFYNLWQGKADELAQYRANIQAAHDQATAKNEQILRDAERNTADVARIYGNHIADLDRTYSSRLLSSKRDCARSATDALTAKVTDGVSSNTRPDPVTFEAQCIRLELDCAKTTLTHIHLQDWVLRVCK